MNRGLLVTLNLLAIAGHAWADDADKAKASKRPPVSVTYYLSGVDSASDDEALRTALGKAKSVSKTIVDPQHAAVTVTFDSHVVSYHQIAQAIVDAGAGLGKQFTPRLKIRIPDYAKNSNAAKVDAVLGGKRLNQRVRIEPLDKSKGEFAVHFLPLKLDAALTEPQGFNGGHLNHPIHDAPPRGLGLEFQYVTEGKVP